MVETGAKIGHTPDEWVPSVHTGNVITKTDGTLIAAVFGDDPECKPDERMKANQHLIAAAPDLLEALKRLLTGWRNETDTLQNAVDAAWAAIAKAEGSSHE